METNLRNSIKARERFMCSFEKRDKGCWEWTRNFGTAGYGKFDFEGRTLGAHRVSWVFHKGEIPDGLCVLHRCDNRRCVRPDHLFLGTNTDNTADSVKKGRRKGGHPPTKLTDSDIVKILEMYANGKFSTQIAVEFGLSDSYVRRILRGTGWAHIPRPKRSLRVKS